MKVRDGFVSNSSSTAFFFVFKGATKESLYDMLEKHATHFDLIIPNWWGDREDMMAVNHEEVFTELKKVLEEEKEGFYKTPQVLPIDDLIQTIEQHKQYWEDELANLRKDSKYDFERDYDEVQWHFDEIQEAGRRLKLLSWAKKQRFTHYLRVEFGDSHGHIKGGKVGCAMDYAGRHINIANMDFVVFTEQNR